MSSPETERPAEGAVEHETVIDRAEGPAARAKRWRIALLALLFFGSLAAVKLTGLDDYVDVEGVRRMMESAGAWGFVAFVVLFAVGELMHVPGLVFVGAASIAYGEVLGIAASYTGAMVSVTASFVVVRAIGGQPLGDIKRPFMRKMLARLETQPIRTVALLRLLLFMAPALNYGLAMSRVRLREYVIGSAIGLLLPIPIVVLVFDWLAARLL